MQRMRDERGAVGVVVALLMVPLIGFAAIAIDVSAMYAERQQLQTGADAGALAIAQDCGRGACGSTVPDRTDVRDLESEQGLIDRNRDLADGFAGHRAQRRGQAALVRSRPRGQLEHASPPQPPRPGDPRPAGPPCSHSRSPVRVEKADRGWHAVRHHPTTIYLTKTSPSTASPPIAPDRRATWSPEASAGSRPTPARCKTTSTIGGILHSDPGNSVPSSCSTSDLAGSLGRTVLLPIFDAYYGSGNTATYRMYGYAAFKLTGYHFGGQNNSSPSPCNGNDRCIAGYFMQLRRYLGSVHLRHGRAAARCLHCPAHPIRESRYETSGHCRHRGRPAGRCRCRGAAGLRRPRRPARPGRHAECERIRGHSTGPGGYARRGAGEAGALEGPPGHGGRRGRGVQPEHHQRSGRHDRPAARRAATGQPVRRPGFVGTTPTKYRFPRASNSCRCHWTRSGLSVDT